MVANALVRWGLAPRPQVRFLLWCDFAMMAPVCSCAVARASNSSIDSSAIIAETAFVALRVSGFQWKDVWVPGGEVGSVGDSLPLLVPANGGSRLVVLSAPTS